MSDTYEPNTDQAERAASGAHTAERLAPVARRRGNASW